MSIVNKFLLFQAIFSILCGNSILREGTIKSFLQYNRIHNPYYSYSSYSGAFRINNDFWKLSLKPIIIDSIVAKEVLGSEFSRFGISARFQEAYIKYEKNNDYYLFLGRRPLHWGQVSKLSIIKSTLTPTYDQMRLGLNLWNLEFDMFLGQLNSNVENNTRIRRLISSHKINIKLFDEKLLMGFGEQIIYTGESRSLELFYINPFVPYMFGQIDNDDLSSINVNNDNYILFFYGRFENVIKNTSLYWELIIDDYQYNADPVQDMMGWKFGLMGAFSVSNYHFHYETNYTQIDSWTYIHGGQFTTWQNRGHSIGYPYGGDLRSLGFKSKAWLNKDKLNFHMQYTLLEKGSNNIDTKSANYNSLSDPFPYEPVKVFHMFESTLTYYTKFLSLRIGYSNFPFPYEIANGLIKKLNGGLFVNLQFKLDFEIKMN